MASLAHGLAHCIHALRMRNLIYVPGSQACDLPLQYCILLLGIILYIDARRSSMHASIPPLHHLHAIAARVREDLLKHAWVVLKHGSETPKGDKKGEFTCTSVSPHGIPLW